MKYKVTLNHVNNSWDNLIALQAVVPRDGSSGDICGLYVAPQYEADCCLQIVPERDGTPQVFIGFQIQDQYNPLINQMAYIIYDGFAKVVKLYGNIGYTNNQFFHDYTITEDTSFALTVTDKDAYLTELKT